jgi:ATP-binding cassette subfamily B protein
VGDRIRGAKAVVGIAWKADPVRTTFVTAMSIAQQASTPLFGVALGWLTDGVVRGRPDQARNAIVLYGAVLFYGSVTSVINFPMRMHLREKTSHAIDRNLVDLAGRVPGLEHFERAEYADKVELLRASRTALAGAPDALVYNVAMPVQILVTALILSRAHPAMLALPLFGLPTLYVSQRTSMRLQDLQEDLAERGRIRAHLFTTALSNQAGKELRVFGLGPTLLRRRDEIWQGMERQIVRVNMKFIGQSTLAWAVFALGYIGAVTLVAYDATRGRATPGDVVLAVTLAAQVRGQISQMSGMVQWLIESLKTAERYVWLADHARDAFARSNPAAPKPVPTRLTDGIRFDNVSFSYPGTEVDVLSAVNLHIPAGATVAVVGDNGAGKSTLVKLLARYYDPTTGRILVDGVDLNEIPTEEWRTHLSAGFQDFVRFELTAREVVGIGQIESLDSEPAIEGALDRASATSVVTELSDGLDTQLGKSFEGGLELSGGQWQKLALGRAMMREEPLLLLLDEPTAALDAPSEHALFERYAGAARRAASATGAITLLVSHRFSTVRMADLILVLDGNEIREAGSHAELMNIDGVYAELYELQARAYR